MGCGCQGQKWKPASAEEAAASDAARTAAQTTLRGRMAPGYTWNGPPPATLAAAADDDA